MAKIITLRLTLPQAIHLRLKLGLENLDEPLPMLDSRILQKLETELEKHVGRYKYRFTDRVKTSPIQESKR